MLREDLLNKMVAHCLPEELIEMFMDRIVAKSPIATVVKAKDGVISMVQNTGNGHICTKSVSVDGDGIYEWRCELKDAVADFTQLYVEHYENVKQVILTLLYECVYDIGECNNIIEDIYYYYFEEIIGSYEEKRGDVDKIKSKIDPAKLKREIWSLVCESIPDNYRIYVTAYDNAEYNEVQIKVEKVEPTLNMYNEPDEKIYCHMTYLKGSLESYSVILKEVHNECSLDEVVEFLLSNGGDRIEFFYLGPEFAYEYSEEDDDVEEEPSELDAYLSDMADYNQDVDDDDLPF